MSVLFFLEQVFYRSNQVYQQQIVIRDINTPLNLTIIIPKFLYMYHSNRSIQSLSPFEKNIACTSMISHLLIISAFLVLNN